MGIFVAFVAFVVVDVFSDVVGGGIGFDMPPLTMFAKDSRWLFSSGVFVVLVGFIVGVVLDVGLVLLWRLVLGCCFVVGLVVRLVVAVSGFWFFLLHDRCGYWPMMMMMMIMLLLMVVFCCCWCYCL